jgi:hypothetical protein
MQPSGSMQRCDAVLRRSDHSCIVNTESFVTWNGLMDFLYVIGAEYWK